MTTENPFDTLAKDAEQLRGLIITYEDEINLIEQTHLHEFGKYVYDPRWRILKDKISKLTSTLYDYQSICDAYLEDKHLDDVYDTLGDAPDIHLKIRFDEEEDDTFLIEQIRAMDICVIEEPLTCCDDLPEPSDLTEQLNHIVEDAIEYTFSIIEPEEKMYSEI